jgi:hypothetical protein
LIFPWLSEYLKIAHLWLYKAEEAVDKGIDIITRENSNNVVKVLEKTEWLSKCPD